MSDDNPWAAPSAPVAPSAPMPTGAPGAEAPDRRLFWATLIGQFVQGAATVNLVLAAANDQSNTGVQAAYFCSCSTVMFLDAWWTWRLLLASEVRGGPARIPAPLAALLAPFPVVGWAFWIIALRDGWRKLSDDPAPPPWWAEATCLLSLLTWCTPATALVFRPRRAALVSGYANALIMAAVAVCALRFVWVYQTRAEQGARRA